MLNKGCMERLESGEAAHFAGLLERLAKDVASVGGVSGAATIGYVVDADDIGSDEFVPEITLRVRRLGENE